MTNILAIRPSLVAGVDVGGGEAETVVYVCECKPGQSRIIDLGAWRGEDTRGQVVGFLNEFRPRLSIVHVDAIGVGHNFGLHLRDHRFKVELVNVGKACESKPNLRENDPAVRFVNLKAQFYQALADAFERDQIDGLTDEATIGQLAGLLYEIDPHGRMKIESKEKARERGVPSPDRAEALMLALCKPPQHYEYTPVPRGVNRLESFEEETPSYMYPDHSDDRDSDSPVRTIRSRRGEQWLYSLPMGKPPS